MIEADGDFLRHDWTPERHSHLYSCNCCKPIGVLIWQKNNTFSNTTWCTWAELNDTSCPQDVDEWRFHLLWWTLQRVLFGACGNQHLILIFIDAALTSSVSFQCLTWGSQLLGYVMAYLFWLYNLALLTKGRYWTWSSPVGSRPHLSRKTPHRWGMKVRRRRLDV